MAASGADIPYKKLLDQPDSKSEVRVNVADEKDSQSESKNNLGLNGDTLKKLNDPNNFQGVSAETRTDILNTVALEIGYLEEKHSAEEIGSALCRLYMENPILRRQVRAGNPNDNIFNISSYDAACCDALVRTPLDCCAFGGEPEAALFCCLVGGSAYIACRPVIKTCNSQQSSTTKFLKILLPIGLAALVFYELYSHFSEPFGDFLVKADSRFNATDPSFNRSLGTWEIGTVLVPLFFAWITCCITGNLAAQRECLPEAKPDLDLTDKQVEKYLKKHPVNEEVFKAIKESNIEKMLTQWNKPERGDNADAVRDFSRELINSWVQTIKHKKDLEQNNARGVNRMSKS